VTGAAGSAAFDGVAEPPRVAVVVPATDTAVELELPGLLAGRASLHVARARLAAVTIPDLLALEDDALVQVAAMAPIRPAVTVFGCTSGSFVRGRTEEEAFAARLTQAAGSPVVLTARAMVTALRRRGTRVRLVAAYTDDVVAAEVDYLRSFGLEVASALGMGITEDERTAAVTGRELLAAATTHGDDGADVVMISCTNFRTSHLHAELERRLGLPVVSSNLAMAQAVLDFLDGVSEGDEP